MTARKPSGKPSPAVSQKPGQQPTAKGVIADIEEMPAEEKEKVIDVLVSRSEIFAGPLPHPDILKGYQEISPDLPGEILNMAKKEQDFRHSYLKKEAETESRDSLLGIIAAFIICMALVIGGIAAILYGAKIGGTVLAGLGIGSVLMTFITNTRPHYNKSDKSRKSKD